MKDRATAKFNPAKGKGCGIGFTTSPITPGGINQQNTKSVTLGKTLISEPALFMRRIGLGDLLTD